MNSRLSVKTIRQQMEFMNELNERKFAQDALGALNEGTRPISASSSAALEMTLKKKKAEEEAEQILNDRAIIAGYSKDLENKSDVEEKNDASPLFDYNPQAEGEVMPVYLPSGIPNIILDSLDADISPIEQGNRTAKHIATQYAQFKLFGKTLDDMFMQEAIHVGNLLLHGEAKDIEDALTLIRKRPLLLQLQIVATDPLGTPVKGTLLQIAAMSGDFDLKPGIMNEKERGAVERIINTGLLSQEVVAEQLKCITSEEARQENKARIQRYLNIINKFITSIRKKIKKDIFQLEEDISQLEKDLQEERSKEVSAGFIFDPIILELTMKWFENNGEWWNVEGHRSWINAIGKLQSKLSSRDAQVASAGIDNLVDKNEIPDRTLYMPAGKSDFYNTASGLGKDFFIGQSGGRMWEACGRVRPTPRRSESWQKYINHKTSALHT